MLGVIVRGKEGMIKRIREPSLAAELEAMNCAKSILAIDIWTFPVYLITDQCRGSSQHGFHDVLHRLVCHIGR